MRVYCSVVNDCSRNAAECTRTSTDATPAAGAPHRGSFGNAMLAQTCVSPQRSASVNAAHSPLSRFVPLAGSWNRPSLTNKVAKIVQVGAPGGCGIPPEAAAMANSPLSWNVTVGAAFHQSTASVTMNTPTGTKIVVRLVMLFSVLSVPLWFDYTIAGLTVPNRSKLE